MYLGMIHIFGGKNLCHGGLPSLFIIILDFSCQKSI